jgi:hypothetical protein
MFIAGSTTTRHWISSCVTYIHLMMEAEITPETMVNFYHTKWCNIQEDNQSYLYLSPWEHEISPIHIQSPVSNCIYLVIDFNIILSFRSPRQFFFYSHLPEKLNAFFFPFRASCSVHVKPRCVSCCQGMVTPQFIKLIMLTSQCICYLICLRSK